MWELLGGSSFAPTSSRTAGTTRGHGKATVGHRGLLSLPRRSARQVVGHVVFHGKVRGKVKVEYNQCSMELVALIIFPLFFATLMMVVNPLWWCAVVITNKIIKRVPISKKHPILALLITIFGLYGAQVMTYFIATTLCQKQCRQGEPFSVDAIINLLFFVQLFVTPVMGLVVQSLRTRPIFKFEIEVR